MFSSIVLQSCDINGIITESIILVLKSSDASKPVFCMEEEEPLKPTSLNPDLPDRDTALLHLLLIVMSMLIIMEIF